MSNVEGQRSMAELVDDQQLYAAHKNEASRAKAQGLLIELRAQVAEQPLVQFTAVGKAMLDAIDFLLDRYITET